MRKYGLWYLPTGRKRWVRLFPNRAYRKATAVRAFQGMLLRFFFAGKKVELRPVKELPAPTF